MLNWLNQAKQNGKSPEPAANLDPDIFIIQVADCIWNAN
jgi:hypothetical protein